MAVAASSSVICLSNPFLQSDVSLGMFWLIRKFAIKVLGHLDTLPSLFLENCFFLFEMVLCELALILLCQLEEMSSQQVCLCSL